MSSGRPSGAASATSQQQNEIQRAVPVKVMQGLYRRAAGGNQDRVEVRIGNKNLEIDIYFRNGDLAHQIELKNFKVLRTETLFGEEEFKQLSSDDTNLSPSHNLLVLYRSPHFLPRTVTSSRERTAPAQVFIRLPQELGLAPVALVRYADAQVVNMHPAVETFVAGKVKLSTDPISQTPELGLFTVTMDGVRNQVIFKFFHSRVPEHPATTNPLIRCPQVANSELAYFHFPTLSYNEALSLPPLAGTQTTDRLRAFFSKYKSLRLVRTGNSPRLELLSNVRSVRPIPLLPVTGGERAVGDLLNNLSLIRHYATFVTSLF